ncbi:unnamed protein product [Cochlearia groenlandica]
MSDKSSENHYIADTESETDAEAEPDLTQTETSVWWDIENCEVPKGCDAVMIAHNIRSVLLERNHNGSVNISAYGDTNRIPYSTQQALSSTGVSLNHVPPGAKDGSDKKILVDMMLWAMDNPAPANLMLISGDKDFSYALHKLGMKRYNILLARPEKASSLPLVAAADTVWLWTSIAFGHHHHPSVLVCEIEKQRMSVCELCNVYCAQQYLAAHLSGREHRTKAKIVVRQRPYASKSAWCGACNMKFRSKCRYENHIKGRRHQDQTEHSRKHSYWST